MRDRQEMFRIEETVCAQARMAATAAEKDALILELEATRAQLDGQVGPFNGSARKPRPRPRRPRAPRPGLRDAACPISTG